MREQQTCASTPHGPCEHRDQRAVCEGDVLRLFVRPRVAQRRCRRLRCQHSSRRSARLKPPHHLARPTAPPNPTVSPNATPPCTLHPPLSEQAGGTRVKKRERESGGADPWRR
eukprot:919658-Rhodomonas_salina.4